MVLVLLKEAKIKKATSIISIVFDTIAWVKQLRLLILVIYFKSGVAWR